MFDASLVRVRIFLLLRGAIQGLTLPPGVPTLAVAALHHLQPRGVVVEPTKTPSGLLQQGVEAARGGTDVTARAGGRGKAVKVPPEVESVQVGGRDEGGGEEGVDVVGAQGGVREVALLHRGDGLGQEVAVDGGEVC